MKKTIAIILLILSFFVVYFLQVNFFSWFTIAGVKPNLFVILVLFVGVFGGIKIGIPYGVCAGLFLDIVIGKNIGTYGIMLGVISIIGGYFDKNFSKDSRITIMLMIIGCTCIYEIGIYILQIIELSINMEVLAFVTTLLIEIAYNTILTIIVYPLMRMWGYRLEDLFKGKKMLTRYFGF